MNPQDSLNPQNSHPTSQPFWHVTACFFMFDFILQLLFSPFGNVFLFRQSIHTATGRPCRRAPQTKIGEDHAYQVERQQAAIPLSMSVVWRIILKQFMSFIMVCLEKEALLSSNTVTFPFSSWFYGGSFCIHTSSPHGNSDHPPSTRTIMQETKNVGCKGNPGLQELKTPRWIRPIWEILVTLDHFAK